MTLVRKTLLEQAAASPSTPEQVWALVELGEHDAAEASLADRDASDPAWSLVAGTLAAARGEFAAALERLDPLDALARRERARLLGRLGHHEEALGLVADSPDPLDRLVTASLHLEAGEPGPASLALPAEDALTAIGAGAGGEARRLLALAERERLIGEAALQTRPPAAAAVAACRRSRTLARRAGSPTAAALAWSRLGEAHAAASNRWRALRSVTHALDLAGGGRVAAGWLPGIQLRAFEVYRLYGHAELAEPVLQAAHHLVIKLASGIEERAFRETFLIDNRDCQRVIAAWKGEAAWGMDVPRA